MPTFTDISATESAALDSIKNSTTYLGWDDYTGWRVGGPYYTGNAADAYGVTVSGGHVTGLDLRANNLVGPIAGAITGLGYLEVLHVEGNPDLNCSFDLDDLPASVTDFVADYTDSDLAGGSSAMSAVDIEEISIRSASLSSLSVADIIDRIYADRALFTHATPILRIDNLEDETLAYIATHGVSRTPAEIAAIDVNIKALKAGTPVVLSSLTAKLSTVNGTAFVTQSSVDLRPYKDFKLSFSDGSQSLVGWGKAYGTGETLGSELITNGTFDSDLSGWTDSGIGWSHDVSGKAKADGSFGYLFQVFTTVQKGLYKFVGQTSGSVWCGIWDYPPANSLVPNTPMARAGAFNIYFTAQNAANTQAFSISSSSTAVTFDNAGCNKVLTPDTTGLTIVSESGGSTYNWASNEGINPNTASFTLTITNS